MSGANHAAPICIAALTRRGAATALKLAQALDAEGVYVPARLLLDGGGELAGARAFLGPVAGWIREHWDSAGAFLLVMAAGIAVRSVAPLLESKQKDPAVVVFDPDGRFAVPILSGHLGGANELARRAAQALGGTAVVTTATDAAHRPAAEMWARDHGLVAENPRAVVRVNAAWADCEPVGLFVDPDLPDSFGDDLLPHVALRTRSPEEINAFSGARIAVTHREIAFPEGILVLRPPVLALGVGCRRDADPGRVESGVFSALKRAGLSPLSIFDIGTVEAKKDEPALLGLAEKLGVPLTLYPAELLAGVPVLNASERVREAVGTPSVSEAAALKASEGGRLLVPKIAEEIWTLAVALKELKT